MKTRKKLIGILSLSLVAVVVLTGSLAYFTDVKEKNNIFTVAGKGDGDIGTQISLTESLWDGLDGNGNSLPGIDINDPQLGINMAKNYFPGSVIKKDPTITVEKGPIYARFMLSFKGDDGSTITDSGKADEILALTNLDPNAVKSSWDSNKNAYYFTYGRILNVNDQVVLFNELEIPNSWTKDTALNNFEIKIVGQAIQSEGFKDAEEAFGAFPIS